MLYIVRRDSWYIERTVWLLAGLVGLLSTALFFAVHPAFALLTTATGVMSLVVAFTGYCVLGTGLSYLGVQPRLSSGPARLLGVPVYRMRVDSWYLERGIYLVVGTNLTLASLLAMAHSPWWYAFIGFVALASVAFAVTGFCPVANALWYLGFEPRLGPERASAEAAPVR